MTAQEFAQSVSQEIRARIPAPVAYRAIVMDNSGNAHVINVEAFDIADAAIQAAENGREVTMLWRVRS